MYKPFYVETKVTWSDMDANRHMANTTYMSSTIVARVEYLDYIGINMEKLAEWNIGPAVLREELSYFKEGHHGEKIIVTAELNGISENGEIFEFIHNFYKKESGIHMAASRVFGVWFSLDTRKITTLPELMLNSMKKEIGDKPIKIYTMAELRNLPLKPQNIDINTIL